MDGDTKVTAALISATVSLIVGIVTAIVTARIARWQVQSKLDELTQTQFKDLVAKRIEVYPRLWDIAQTFTSGILIAANRGTAPDPVAERHRVPRTAPPASRGETATAGHVTG